MPRTRPGRLPPINGTDPIHASRPPFPRHGCAITNSGRASRELTTFTAIEICSARAYRSRRLLIPKTRANSLRVCRNTGLSPVRPAEMFSAVSFQGYKRAGRTGRNARVPPSCEKTGLPSLNVEFERESDIFVRRMA